MMSNQTEPSLLVNDWRTARDHRTENASRTYTVRSYSFLHPLSYAILLPMAPFQGNTSRPSTLETVLRLHGFFRHRLQPLGVSPVQAGMLLYLDRHPQCQVAEIASALCVHDILAGKTVRLLQKNGWIRKPWIDANRKTVTLELSKQGAALARKISKNIEVTDKLFALADNRTAA